MSKLGKWSQECSSPLQENTLPFEVSSFLEQKGNQHLPAFRVVLKLGKVPSAEQEQRNKKFSCVNSEFCLKCTVCTLQENCSECENAACFCSYLWWATALLARTTAVKMAKAALWTEWPARVKPAHSVISPKKLAPDTYSNMPPVGGRQRH